MKNIQVVDGAVNSVLEIYRVPDDLFELLFPDGQDIAFLDEVDETLRGGGDDIWQSVYRDVVDKKDVIGIHGTLHSTGSKLAPLLGLALAAAGVLLVVEVVAAWVRSPATTGLLVPWPSWRSALVVAAPA